MGEAARDVDAPVSQIKLDVLTECEPAIRGTGIRPLRAVAPPTPPPRSTSRKAATRQHVGPTAAELQRLLQSVVEVLDGRRPVMHLQSQLSLHCYQAIRGTVRTSRHYHSRTVHSVHTCVPSPGVVEACATVRYGDRAQALVLRIEVVPHQRRRTGGWRCTEFRLL